MNTSIYSNQARLGSVVAKSRDINLSYTIQRFKTGVMIIEDDHEMRRMLRLILTSSGYTVFEAACDREALKVWQQSFSQIDLLLTDVCVPYRSTGMEIASKFLLEKSWLKVIYTSGFGVDIGRPHQCSLVEGENFIQKPYAPEILLRILKRQLTPK